MKLIYKQSILVVFFFLFSCSIAHAQEAVLPSAQTQVELEQMYSNDNSQEGDGLSPSTRSGPPIGPPIGGTPLGDLPKVSAVLLTFAYFLYRKKRLS